MGEPAATVAKFHRCPAVTGTVPHVGGPLMAPGEPTVVIGGLAASRATDKATCVGPPDFIVVGSSTVKIGGQMAARLNDPTMHGGAIIAGMPTVLIGGAAAGAILGNPAGAAALFPGKQNFGNCGVQSTQQIVRAGTGADVSEDDMLDRALDQGWARDNSVPSRRGGTSPDDRRSILADRGVNSHLEAQTMENLTQATAERRGVITSNDAGELWNDSRYDGGGHAVNVTGVEYDATGRPANIIINDTGTGAAQNSIPADRFERSLRPGRDANVTDGAVW